MIRWALLICVVAACPGPRKPLDTKPVGSAGGCGPLAEEIDKLPASNACVLKVLDVDPDAAAAALATVTWNARRIRQLDVVQLDGAQWIAIGERAASLIEPNAALAMFDRATRTDRGSDASANPYVYHLRSRLGDDAGAERALTALAERTSSEPALRLGAIATLTQLKREAGVARLCETATPTTIWSCLAGDPGHLKTYLEQILALPTLTPADIATLAAADTKKTLPGLACATNTGWTASPRDVFRRAQKGSPNEARLYYRLHEISKKPQSTCFLEQAARVCAHVIHSELCPVSYAFADYLRALDPSEQQAFVSSLLGVKGGHYSELNAGNKDEEAILLHLHLVLADVFAQQTAARNVLYLTPYHLDRANYFLSRMPGRRVPIAKLVSKQLVKSTCGPPDLGCAKACAGGSWNSSGTCVETCKKLATGLQKPLCGR